MKNIRIWLKDGGVVLLSGYYTVQKMYYSTLVMNVHTSETHSFLNQDIRTFSIGSSMKTTCSCIVCNNRKQ